MASLTPVELLAMPVRQTSRGYLVTGKVHLTADALYAGIILTRYATWLKLAGKDY